MVQRNVLSDLNSISEKLNNLQSKAASNKEISRPSDDPFNAARAMALRQSVNGTRQHQKNVEDAIGWTDSTDQALSSMSESVRQARDLLVQGGTDSADQASRNAIAQQLEQIIDGIKQDASSTYRGSFIFAGTETGIRPYKTGTDDAYYGNAGGLAPGVPGVVREIGPGVTLSLNIVGTEVLG
jgi:flagellar hook-associated protein 3 FlgL